MRRHFTAQGTPYIAESWRDNTSSARRAHIFSPVQSLRTEAHEAGFMPMRWGVLIIIALVAIPATLWAAVF